MAAARTILDGVGPLDWNRRLDADRGLAASVPRWPAVRISDALGDESLYVFPARARAPTLLVGWSRAERSEREVRIFPGYRWILVIERPGPSRRPEPPRAAQIDSAAAATDSAGAAPDPSMRQVRVYAWNGTQLLVSACRGVPMPAGRDYVLWPDTIATAFDSPTLKLLRLPSADVRAAWIAGAGYGAASPLENFIAVNLAASVDPATGIRQDVLRLLDLEGKELWTRPLRADYREFAVSNFGDVAIARERALRVYDRSGTERFHATIPVNLVGRTAMGADGRFVLVAARAAGLGRPAGDLWVALYDTKRRAPVWERRDLSDKRGSEPLEISVSDDGRRSLLRLSSGSVLLLGRDGSVVTQFDLPRIPNGESQAGVVPRRTWLSPDGGRVALITPVARSIAEARGWLYEVPLPQR